MNTSRLFYYAPQRAAVRSILEPILRPEVKLVPVDRPEWVRGHECGAFVNIAGHVQRLPYDLRRELEVYGFLIITLDDSACRSHAAQMAR